MSNKKTFVIADGEYIETYAPFGGSQEEIAQKVKRGILERLGMQPEEIDKVIDGLDLVVDRGVDGEFDDNPYTPVKLIKTVEKEPRQFPRLWPETNDPELEPEPPRKTMLEQFYGSRSKEKRAKKAFARFKSHITTKKMETFDKDGNSKIMEVHTIEDYPGREEDSDLLLLDGYRTRLERLSRAHQEDFSLYEAEVGRITATQTAPMIREVLEKYEEMHKLRPEEAEKFRQEAQEAIDYFSSAQFQKDLIQTLIDSDTEFIETNNYTYNERQHTAENLKTLGKLGEKSVKSPIKDTQSLVQRCGLRVMNAMITVRNYTTAPIHKALGTYVVAPIYRAVTGVEETKTEGTVNVCGYKIKPMEDIIKTSQKRSVGMYKDKPLHRYQARKDYFADEERKAIAERQAKSNDEGKGEKTVTIGSLIRLAIVPRWRALTEVRKGNIAVLNAGLSDLEQAAEKRESLMMYRHNRLRNCIEKIAAYDKEIKELKALAGVMKEEGQLEELNDTIDEYKKCKAVFEGRYIETKRTEIDSVSTDPLSASQHNKANKSKVTLVVKGCETVVKGAAAAYISRYLYSQALQTEKTPDAAEWIEPETVTKEITEDITTTHPGLDSQGIAAITFSEATSDTQKLTRWANGGKEIVVNSAQVSKVRGTAFTFHGKTYSGSDGHGFDANVLTSVQVDMDGGSSIAATIETILEKVTGKDYTSEEIANLIASGEISGINVWKSHSTNGVPKGWADVTTDVKDMIANGSHTITETVTRTTTQTIPGRWEIVPGEEYAQVVSKLNPAVAAAMVGIAADELASSNEMLRFTRGRENIQRRSREELKRAAEINKQKNKGVKVKGTREGDTPKRDTLGAVKSFARNNKPKERQYTYRSRLQQASERAVEEGRATTAFTRFYGDEKKDLEGPYTEHFDKIKDPPEPGDWEEI